MTESRNRHDDAGTSGPDTTPRGGIRSVDVTAAGVHIDGALLEPLTVSALAELFGTPRIEAPDAPADAKARVGSTWAIWDEFGVRAATKDGDNAGELSIRLVDAPAWDERRSAAGRRFFPSHSYPGTFTINGRPPLEAIAQENLRKAREFLSANAGHWGVELFLHQTECGELSRMEFPEWFAKMERGELAAIVQSAAHPFREATIHSIAPKPVRKSSGKWKLPAATEPVVEIASFPFRLAIIQELMYGQDLLKPRFDVHDFAQDQGARSFDPNGFSDKIIPSVRTWFRKLPIPARLAENVETLVLDGGNDIYLQLIPQWDGEDERFMIKTLSDDDLAPFTRLRSVEDIGGFLGPRARSALTSRGITVE